MVRQVGGFIATKCPEQNKSTKRQDLSCTSIALWCLCLLSELLCCPSDCLEAQHSLIKLLVTEGAASWEPVAHVLPVIGSRTILAEAAATWKFRAWMIQFRLFLETHLSQRTWHGSTATVSSHKYPFQRAYPVVCCLLSSTRTGLLLIKAAESILWLTCSLYSLISLHWKRVLLLNIHWNHLFNLTVSFANSGFLGTNKIYLEKSLC